MRRFGIGRLSDIEAAKTLRYSTKASNMLAALTVGTAQHRMWSHVAPAHSDRSATEAPNAFYLRSNVLAEYRVERIISIGTMGAVVTAHHPRRDGLVVIKLLNPWLCNDPTSVSRLSREAHVLTRIASAHVVRLLDTGWTELVGPYIVLEYLEGMDLNRTLKAKGPLPVALAVDYLLQACDGLSVAHAAGITHRDIKPENLFCMEGDLAPRLKLIDFGISQYGPESFPYRDVPDSKPETELMGTPAYMAPERILDLPTTDQRSDIWSLGVVLHELLTARSLFGREDIGETCTRVLRHRFELEANGAVLPSALRIVVARCLARHPAHRFQSVQDLAHALRSAIALPERSRGLLTGKFRRPVPTQREAPPVSTGSHPRGPGPLPAAPDAQPRRSSSFGRGGRRRWTLLSLALLSVVLLGIAVSELVGAWRFGETQPISGEPRLAVLVNGGL